MMTTFCLCTKWDLPSGHKVWKDNFHERSIRIFLLNCNCYSMQILSLFLHAVSNSFDIFLFLIHSFLSCQKLVVNQDLYSVSCSPINIFSNEFLFDQRRKDQFYRITYSVRQDKEMFLDDKSHMMLSTITKRLKMFNWRMKRKVQWNSALLDITILFILLCYGNEKKLFHWIRPFFKPTRG